MTFKSDCVGRIFFSSGTITSFASSSAAFSLALSSFSTSAIIFASVSEALFKSSFFE